MNNTETHSVEFENTVASDFKATITYTCTYEYSTPAHFSSSLPLIEVTQAGVIQEWTLPEIEPGSLPFDEFKFVPDVIIAPYISLIPPALSDVP